MYLKHLAISVITYTSFYWLLIVKMFLPFMDKLHDYCFSACIEIVKKKKKKKKLSEVEA